MTEDHSGLKENDTMSVAYDKTGRLPEDGIDLTLINPTTYDLCLMKIIEIKKDK